MWLREPRKLYFRYEIMKYKNIIKGKFLERPNRFIAHVEIDGKEETVHVKNTGRCREILMPGVEVFLEKSDNPTRKTAYDLVTANKPGFGLINIDSQSPNKLAMEWLSERAFDYIKPEYTYGKSRIDFYMERGNSKFLMEVKGCTLEVNGMGYFPDAPTERGVKHLHELAAAAKEGYEAILCFVIQMEGICEVRVEENIHPEFAEALAEAEAAGVRVLFLMCEVKEQEVKVVKSNFEI